MKYDHDLWPLNRTKSAQNNIKASTKFWAIRLTQIIRFIWFFPGKRWGPDLTVFPAVLKVCIPEHLWVTNTCTKNSIVWRHSTKLRHNSFFKDRAIPLVPRPKLLRFQAGCRKAREAHSNRFLGPTDTDSGLVGYLGDLRNMHNFKICHRWFSSQPSLGNTQPMALYIVKHTRFTNTPFQKAVLGNFLLQMIGLQQNWIQSSFFCKAENFLLELWINFGNGCFYTYQIERISTTLALNSLHVFFSSHVPASHSYTD